MKKIEFSGNFDAILCLDGSFPGVDLFDHLKGIPVIAADGAAIHLMEYNIEFEKVIGDLDTLRQKGWIDKIPAQKKVFLPNQDANDFDKALNYADKNGMKRILITGMHGGELEHTLNNWSVFMRYAAYLNLCLYESGRYGIPLFESTALDIIKDEMISLIPQPSAIVTTKGLKWELENEALELGYREGARNTASNDRIEIEIHSGSILLFIDSRLPKSVGYKSL